LFDGVLDRVVLGVKRLDEHASWQIAAAGAASNLSQQLKRAFRRAKVRQVEGRIRTDHADERHAMKVMALREHLRADQNIERAAGKRAERFLKLPLGARGIAIEPRNPRAREFLAQPFFQMLRAFAKKINILGIALRALLGNRLD